MDNLRHTFIAFASLCIFSQPILAQQPMSPADAHAAGAAAGNAGATAAGAQVDASTFAGVMPTYGADPTAEKATYGMSTGDLAVSALSQLSTCQAMSPPTPACEALIKSQTNPLTRQTFPITSKDASIVASNAILKDPSLVIASIASAYSACTQVTEMTPTIYDTQHCNRWLDYADQVCNRVLNVDLATVTVLTLGSSCFSNSRWASPWLDDAEMNNAIGWVASGYRFIYANGGFDQYIPSLVKYEPDPLGQYNCGRYRNNFPITQTTCDYDYYGNPFNCVTNTVNVSTQAGIVFGNDYGCVDGREVGRGGSFSFCNLASCPIPTISYDADTGVYSVGCTGLPDGANLQAGIYCPDGYYQTQSNPVKCRENIGLVYDNDPAYAYLTNRVVTSQTPGVTTEQQIYTKDSWDDQCAPFKARLP